MISIFISEQCPLGIDSQWTKFGCLWKYPNKEQRKKDNRVSEKGSERAMVDIKYESGKLAKIRSKWPEVLNRSTLITVYLQLLLLLLVFVTVPFLYISHFDIHASPNTRIRTTTHAYGTFYPIYEYCCNILFTISWFLFHSYLYYTEQAANVYVQHNKNDVPEIYLLHWHAQWESESERWCDLIWMIKKNELNDSKEKIHAMNAWNEWMNTRHGKSHKLSV